MREALTLQEEILRHIPATALKVRPKTREKLETPTSRGPLEFACYFYEIEKPPGDSIQRKRVDIPFVTNFEDLIFLTTTTAASLMSCTGELAKPLRDAFAQSILLVMRLLGRVDQRSDAPFQVDWDSSKWLSVVLDSVEHLVRQTLSGMLCDRSHSGL